MMDDRKENRFLPGCVDEVHFLSGEFAIDTDDAQWRELFSWLRSGKHGLPASAADNSRESTVRNTQISRVC